MSFSDSTSRLKKIGFAVFAIALFLILMETAARFAEPGLWQKPKPLPTAYEINFEQFASFNHYMNTYHDKHEFLPASQLMIFDKELFWRLAPGKTWKGKLDSKITHYQTDKNGFRTNDYSADKLRGKKIIAAFGDSCTFGLWVEQNERYTDQLQNLLGSEKWAVVNFGMIGYNSFQILKLAKITLPKLKPDYVVFYSATNDRNKVSGPPDHKINSALAISRTINSLQEHSAFFSLARKSISLATQKRKQAKTHSRRVPLGNYVDNVEKLAALCKEIGAKLILLRVPNNYASPPVYYKPESPKGMELVEKGSNALSENLYKDAFDFFEQALNQNPKNAFAAYGAAKAKESISAGEDANRAYKKAYELVDKMLHRYLDALDGFKEKDDVFVIDLEYDMCIATNPREVFVDICHPNPKGHKIIADKIYNLISQTSNTDRSVENR